jgi:hypothetical protein
LEGVPGLLTPVDAQFAPDLAAALVAGKLANNRDGCGTSEMMPSEEHRWKRSVIRQQLLEATG